MDILYPGFVVVTDQLIIILYFILFRLFLYFFLFICYRVLFLDKVKKKKPKQKHDQEKKDKKKQKDEEEILQLNDDAPGNLSFREQKFTSFLSFIE